MTKTPGGRQALGEVAPSSRPNHYRNGRAFEYRVRTRLRNNGFHVFRMAGSKTKVDMFVARPGELLIVQCKRSGALPPAEWNELFDLCALFPTGIPILAVGGRGNTFWQLTERKEKRGRQPMVPYLITPR